MTDNNDDTERHRQTQEVNDRAQQAIAETRKLIGQLNTSMDDLEDFVTLSKGSHHAQ